MWLNSNEFSLISFSLSLHGEPVARWMVLLLRFAVVAFFFSRNRKRRIGNMIFFCGFAMIRLLEGEGRCLTVKCVFNSQWN